MRIFPAKRETLVNIAAKYFNALYSNGKKKIFVKIKYSVFKFRVLLKDLILMILFVFGDTSVVLQGVNFFLITCINGHPVPL